MKNIPVSLMLMAVSVALRSQPIGIGTDNPHASAQLELSSTSKGFLMPRLTTTQRDAIASPAKGLMIFNLDDNSTDSWNGSSWEKHFGMQVQKDALGPGKSIITNIIGMPADQYIDVSWTKRGSILSPTKMSANVGIGTASPTAKLDVAGNVKVTGFQIAGLPDNLPGIDYLLQSDANGVGRWVNPANLGVSPTGPAGGDLIGSYPNPNLANTSIIAGTYTKITVDAKGRATQGSNLTAGDITPLETDPKVGSNFFPYLSKWNGSALISSSISDNGLNVGIGVAAPLKKLEVSGSGGLRVNSTNTGSGVSDWVAGNFGSANASSNRVAIGLLRGIATIAGMDNQLNTSQNLSINLGGNVSIGNISADKKLNVAGNGGLQVNSTNTGTGAYDWVAGNFGGTAGDRVVMGLLNGVATVGAMTNNLGAWSKMAINPGGGNVGVGNFTPTAKLDVAGTVKLGVKGSVLNSIAKYSFVTPASNVAAHKNLTYTATQAGFGLVAGATVLVSPSVELPPGVSVSYTIAGTDAIQVNLYNSSPNDYAIPAFTFWVVIIM